MALPPGYADSVHEYPNHAAQLLEHFAELRKESRLHDIILKLADGEWRAHKCVLSAFSGFFRTLFMGSGSRDKEVKLKTVTCKGIGPLLEYMYTGRLELVEENVMEVFCTAGYLQVFNVLSDISTFLSSTTLSTQQKGYSNNSIFDINNDCSEETYNHSVCDVMNVQHDSRSESPDSGTQSGEEFRTDEETAPLSGKSLNMLAAEMTADASVQFSSAFAQVLSMDVAQYNQQNVMPVTHTPVTIVDTNGLPSMVNQQNLMSVTQTPVTIVEANGLPSMVNQQNLMSGSQTPVTIVDTNGLPSMVILEQGQVDQSDVVAQEQESSVGEQDRSMGEEMHNTDTLEQLVHLSTEGYTESPLQETFETFSSTQEQPDENTGCALPEEAAKFDSEQASCSNGASGMENTVCMALPISDVGTAEVKSFLVPPEVNDTEEDQGVIDVEQDTSTTAMSNNSNTSLAKTRTSDNVGEQPVVEQGKVQVIQGEDTPVEEVLRDDSLTMQTGDVLSELGTEGKSSVQHAPMAADDNSETSQALPNVPAKNMGEKRNLRRKTRRKAAQRGWKSKYDPYSCSICGEEFQTNRKLQNHMTKVHAGQTEPETVDRVSSVTMQTEASQEAGIDGCKKKKKKKRKKKSAVVNEPRAIGYTNDGTAEFQTLQESEMEPKGKTARFDHITLEMLTKRRRKLKNDPYVCRICGEELQSSGKLRTHMANHEGGKKYECPICAAKFGYSNHLADHMRIHTGERPHKCKQCDANFKQRSTLIRHERRHTGIMPYRCAVCNRGFHDTTHLKMHLKTHAAKEDKVQEEDFGVALLQKVCESQELS